MADSCLITICKPPLLWSRLYSSRADFCKTGWCNTASKLWQSPLLWPALLRQAAICQQRNFTCQSSPKLSERQKDLCWFTLPPQAILLITASTLKGIDFGFKCRHSLMQLWLGIYTSSHAHKRALVSVNVNVFDHSISFKMAPKSPAVGAHLQQLLCEHLGPAT